MKRFVLNAFSLNMLAGTPAAFEVEKAEVSEDRNFVLLAESAVGHADIARVASNMLGAEIAVNRATVTLNPGDEALVIQYRGDRLPEGATKLPEGASLDLLFVKRTS